MVKPIAYIGRKVHCPKCEGDYPIVEGVTTTTFYGKGVALVGMHAAYIDIEKAKAGAAQLVTIDEIVRGWRTTRRCAERNRGDHQISHRVKNSAKDVLVQSPKIPASSIFTPSSLRFPKGVVKGLKVVRVFAIGRRL